MQRPFIVCQPEKCTGCQLCEFACSARYGGYNPGKSEIRLVRRQPAAIMAIACRLCDEPTCMYACPRECISVSETTGIMLVDKDVCNGCGWCVEACEFGAVSINHDERIVSKQRRNLSRDILHITVTYNLWCRPSQGRADLFF